MVGWLIYREVKTFYIDYIHTWHFKDKNFRNRYLETSDTVQ